MYSNASCYEYYDVPKFVWEGLRVAPSAGSFINKILKTLNFKFTRI